MRKLTPLLLLLFFSNIVLAQQKRITGTVVDKSKGQPLAGVSVQTKNTTTTTNADGKFSIDAAMGDEISFNYTGMKPYRFKVSTGNQDIAVQLDEDPLNLSEVVVVGYTGERKKDLKGAVSVVKMNEALKETNANLLTSLQGRITGVTISTDGAPGSGTNIYIRGLGSFNNVSPLYVIDGIPTLDFNGLSPNDVESIQVLKDAASAAIYGARAAGGVIVITTKKGSKSKNAQMTFDAYYGVKTRRDHIDMLNAQEYGQVLWQTYKNDHNGATPNDAVYGNGPNPTIPAFIDAPTNLIPSGDVDYQKEVYQPAINQSYNLGVSKTADKSTFYFGLNYNKEDGLAKYTNYDRLTLRMNSSFKVSNRITVGENLSLGYLTGVREADGRSLESALLQVPIIPLRDNAGNWGGPVKNLGDRLNPVGDLYRNRDNKTRGWRTFGNVFATVDLLKGLSYNVSFAVDAVNSRYKGFSPRYVEGRFSQTDNFLTEVTNTSLNLTATHTLNYQWTKRKHDVHILAGYEWINNKFDTYNTTKKDFFLESPDYRYLNAGSTLVSSNGTGREYGLISQFGKIDYKFNDRYLFGASVRRDGSSRFGVENRYAIFAAFSAAWRISDEAFFRKLKVADRISELKLRASWGQNGNDQIPDYTYSTFYAPNPDYSYYDITGSNTGAVIGFYPYQIGNPRIKWEASEQTNIGLDLGLFDNRVYITADYFIKKTNDLLVRPSLLGVLGEGIPPYINAGNIRNNGLELMISYRNKGSRKLKYNFDLTFTSIQNKVISVGDDGNSEIIGGYSKIVKGQPLGVFYGYEADGIFKTQDEVNKSASQPGKGLGRIRYRDVNGDGKITPEDRTYIGSPLPKFTLGLNTSLSYGNFDASFFIDANVGNKIYDDSKKLTYFNYFVSNHGKVLLNAWSPANQNSDIPSLTANNTNDEWRTSSFFLGDGSYVRLKSATIGYNMPKKALDKIRIASLRIFVQAQNLVSLTKFKGLDYEVLNTSPLDYGVLRQAAYPHSKSVSFGINVGF